MERPPSTRPVPPDARRFQLGVAGEGESIVYPIVFGVLVLLCAVGPAYEAWLGVPVSWGFVVVIGIFCWGWYWFVTGVHCIDVEPVDLEPGGTVTFHRLYSSRTVPVGEIVRIRPWFYVSRHHFVLEHSAGTEYLPQDPTTVWHLAQMLLTVHPRIELVSLSKPSTA